MARDRFQLTIESDRFVRFTNTLTSGMTFDGAADALVGVALDFTQRVVRMTPVDEGRARAGWTSFADKQGVPVELDPKRPNNEAIAKGKRESKSRSKLHSGIKQYIEIENGVPYILALELGHSDQAPGGFFRIAMREIAAGRAMTVAQSKELYEQIAKANLKIGRGRGGG